MPDFKRILVPTDLTPCAKLALRYAIELAEESGAELHLIHIIEEVEGGDMPGVGNLQDVYARLREVLSVEMRMEVREIGGRDLGSQQHIRRGAAAAPGILDYAQEEDIDLIVIGTHGRQGAERFLVGSTAERVVRFADSHVLTVGPSGGWAANIVRRILVATDFSGEAENVVRWGHNLSKHYNARLDLLYVVEPVLRPVFYGDENVGFEFNGKKMEDQARAALEKLKRDIVGRHGNGRIHVARGRAAQEISRVSREHDINLIVQGKRGLSEDVQLRLGHVAEETVRRAPAPVFTVSPRGIRA